MELAGTIIGYIAVAVNFLIYQQKTKRGLLTCKACADVLWITHYCLIGGYTGAAVNGVALIREVFFFNNDKNSKTGKIALMCFLCASVICSILTWKSVFSLFAMAGSLISVISFWIGSPKVSRILSFPVSACMLIYGVSNHSLAVLINEILVMVSSVIGILHHDRAGKAKAS